LIIHSLFFYIFIFSVGITWEDAPTEQSAIFGQPYKVRCVVRANPPATIDWQKNGVGFTTSRRLLFIFIQYLFIYLFIRIRYFSYYKKHRGRRLSVNFQQLYGKAISLSVHYCLVSLTRKLFGVSSSSTTCSLVMRGGVSGTFPGNAY
jgi:hypothetical protein